MGVAILGVKHDVLRRAASVARIGWYRRVAILGVGSCLLVGIEYLLDMRMRTCTHTRERLDGQPEAMGSPNLAPKLVICGGEGHVGEGHL